MAEHVLKHGPRKTVAAQGEPLAWYVSGPQTLSRVYPPGGDAVYVWTVPFTTRTGETGSVDIPADLYTPENVADAIRHAAATLDQIHHLNSETQV